MTVDARSCQNALGALHSASSLPWPLLANSLYFRGGHEATAPLELFSAAAGAGIIASRPCPLGIVYWTPTLSAWKKSDAPRRRNFAAERTTARCRKWGRHALDIVEHGGKQGCRLLTTGYASSGTRGHIRTSWRSARSSGTSALCTSWCGSRWRIRPTDSQGGMPIGTEGAFRKTRSFDWNGCPTARLST